MAEPLIIKDVRPYPDGKLYESVYEIKNPDDQRQLRMAKESLDIQYWSAVKRMLADPGVSGTPAGYIPAANRFRIVKPTDDVAWIIPDEGAPAE